MARHIMAVCVVCLLCADHLPCKQHDADSGSEPRLSGGSTFSTVAAMNSIFRRPDTVAPGKVHLVKRHTHDHDHHHHGGGHDHDHDDEDDDRTAEVRDKLDTFMVSIFKEFGDPTSMTMDVAGFENMMKRLNMYRLVTERIGGSGSSSSLVTSSAHDRDADSDDACINSVAFVKRIAIPKPLAMATTGPAERLSQNNYDSAASTNTSSSSSNKSNTTVSVGGSSSNSTVPSERTPSTKSNGSSNGSITSELDRLKASIRLDRDDLFNICPILLAQLASKTSRQRAGCIDPTVVPELASLATEASLYPSKEHVGEQGDSTIELSVWIYSTLAVLGVSLCGLLGVAVIPCMDKHFYQHAIQFLVALAVGTLCGDALLHLLPHAMMATTMKNSHDEMMFKGLAAVGGIVFFYFMERFLTVVAEWYKHQEKKDKPSSRVRVMREPESSSLQIAGSGEKQCKHKYSSYPYCYDEIATETKDDHHEHNHMENHLHNNHNNASAKCANNHSAVDHGGEHTGDYVSLHHISSKDDSTNQDNNTVSTNLDDASIESESTKPKMQAENYTIILREHETKHHGHTHMHGHVHSPPGSLSAVAWMVIMGDGLHNFTDGMTIGAAFANNIAGGFSTAIAVFCHELPHELGDFAVLLKAGMSARDAVYYNLLSSILSFIGVIIGIVIGHQPEASAWVFSVAAGLFLYIALVDMIPELTSAHGTEDRCKTSEFLLQFFGMTSGFGIMLLIAMYEHDLKELFVD
ncbi:zinc transporter foi [Armigeres subalbatus]|uniref:zinc transporter foi n=1 Tax=Armigeres subalbatus TaxID=124917 RepID=UPI002ED6B550